MDRLALARSGRDTIGAWATYAQGLRLLSALHERGWIAFLAQPRGVDALVEFSGLPEGRVRNVLGALTAYGVVEKAGNRVQLAPAFAELIREDGWSTLAEILDETEMMDHLAGRCAPDLGDGDRAGGRSGGSRGRER